MGEGDGAPMIDLVLDLVQISLAIGIVYLLRHPETPAPPIPAPVAAPRAPLAIVPVDAPARIEPQVNAVFMDANERHVLARVTMDAKRRRPVVTYGGQRFQCTQQDADGCWVYRAVSH